MRIVVLGAAAGGGFPQWNCRCANCERARRGDPAAVPRTQSSIAVSSDGEDWFLMNASPDLRQQIMATPALHPRRDGRHSPVSGVVITNGDVDHVAGLLTLRERQPLTVFATPRILQVLEASAVFNVLAPDVVQRRAVAAAVPFELLRPDGTPSGLEATLFAVPGKVALYLEDEAAGPEFGTIDGDTVGVAIAEPSAGARCHYIPGCAAMTPELAARLQGSPLVLFDGTLWRDDEMIEAWVGAKTGRRMGHISMSGADGSLAAFEDIRIARKVFVHLNNTNPALIAGTPERRAVEAAGWEVAWDGMEVVL